MNVSAPAYPAAGQHRQRLSKMLRLAVAFLFSIGFWSLSASAQDAPPARRSPPRVQAIPEPRLGASFQVDGRMILGFDSGLQGMRRPFLYPVLGPAGRSLTRMGHPHDPVSHSHHNSVWIAHNDIGGVDFWSDKGGMIETLRITRLEDGDRSASVELQALWKASDGSAVLNENRRISLHVFTAHSWRIDVESELLPAGTEPVVAGSTAFGFLGVRVAKTIGVRDGGGVLTNSEGGHNEAGCFRKPARWVDYSGPVTAEHDEGITLMDHPQNPNHPTEFHVRDDGWMGAANTFRAPFRIDARSPLRLKYGLLIHRAPIPPAQIDEAWLDFSKTAFAPFPASAARK